jgi:hypothetical protein
VEDETDSDGTAPSDPDPELERDVPAAAHDASPPAVAAGEGEDAALEAGVGMRPTAIPSAKTGSVGDQWKAMKSKSTPAGGKRSNWQSSAAGSGAGPAWPRLDGRVGASESSHLPRLPSLPQIPSLRQKGGRTGDDCAAGHQDSNMAGYVSALPQTSSPVKAAAAAGLRSISPDGACL